MRLALLAIVYLASSITTGAQTNEEDEEDSTHGSPINANQVAILHWNSANQTATFPVTSTHNAGPHAVAFDRANIWTANLFDSTVTKVRASDGTNLAVGSFPLGAVYDGANIRVANCGGNTVTKLRASDGSTVGTFAAGNCPLGLAFDGSNIWVANAASNTVTKLVASDGSNKGTFAVGKEPVGIAFDGQNVWVVNASSNTVSKLRASDGAILAIFPVGNHPVGVAFDGRSMWVANSPEQHSQQAASSRRIPSGDVWRRIATPVCGLRRSQYLGDQSRLLRRHEITSQQWIAAGDFRRGQYS
jgi:hypothetical protein